MSVVSVTFLPLRVPRPHGLEARHEHRQDGAAAAEVHHLGANARIEATSKARLRRDVHEMYTTGSVHSPKLTQILARTHTHRHTHTHTHTHTPHRHTHTHTHRDRHTHSDRLETFESRISSPPSFRCPWFGQGSLPQKRKGTARKRPKKKPCGAASFLVVVMNHESQLGSVSAWRSASEKKGTGL